MRDALLIGIMAAWLLATLVSQFRPATQRIPGWPDRLLLILRTRLFVRAPCNLHLWYRDRPESGAPGAWQRIEWQAGKSWVSLFWAPRFWRELHLFGILNRVLRVQKRKPRAKQTSNVWYHLTLAHVRELPRAPTSQARQFRIVSDGGHLLDSEPTVLFVSDFHPW